MTVNVVYDRKRRIDTKLFSGYQTERQFND